ncbi:hypothetical protein ACR2XN_29105, partial [Klebsiella pneumoniae]
VSNVSTGHQDSPVISLTDRKMKGIVIPDVSAIPEDTDEHKDASDSDSDDDDEDADRSVP